MTSIPATHPAVAGLNTQWRLADLSTLANTVYTKMTERPRRVGLLVTPLELVELSYVRVNDWTTISNRSSKWTRNTKRGDIQTTLVGWKFISRGGRDNKRYIFEKYLLRKRDYPYDTSNYNPAFYNPCDRPDDFLIPDEGITIEEMLVRLGGVL